MERRNLIHRMMGAFLIIFFILGGPHFLFTQSAEVTSSLLPLRVDPQLHEQEKSQAIQSFIREGQKALNAGDYSEAIIQLQKASRIDSEDRQVQTLLERAIAGYLGEDYTVPETALLEVSEVVIEEPVIELEEEIEVPVPEIVLEAPIEMEVAEEIEVPVPEIVIEEPIEMEVAEDIEVPVPDIVLEAPIEVEVAEEIEVPVPEVVAEQAVSEEALIALEQAREYFNTAAYEQALSQYQAIIGEFGNEHRAIIEQEIEMTRIALDHQQRNRRYSSLIEEAQDYENQGKYEDSLDSYISAQQIYPERDQAQAGILRVSEKLKELESKSRMEQLLSSAGASLEAGQLDQAERYVQQALDIDPGCQEAGALQEKITTEREIERLLLAGYSALEENDFDNALDIARNLTAIDPDNAEIEKYLADLREKEEQSIAAAAREEFENYLEQAVSAFEEGKYEEAKAYIGRASAIEADAPELIALLEQIEKAEETTQISALEEALASAGASLEAGQLDQAERYVQQALDIDPGCQEAGALQEKIATEREIERLLLAGYSALEENDFDSALDIAWDLNAIDPDNAEIEKYLADLREKEEQSIEAAAREEFENYLEQAVSAFEEGKYEEAKIYIENASAIDADAPELMVLLDQIQKVEEEDALQVLFEQAVAASRTALEAGQLEQALQYVQQALDIDPDSQEASTLQEKITTEREINQLLLAGYSALQQYDFDTALDIARDLTEIEPDNEEVVQYLTDMSEKEEQYQVEIRQQEFENHLTQAQKAYQERRYDDATRYADRAFSINPDSPELMVLLDQIQQEEGSSRITDLKKQVVIFERAGDYETALQKSREILEIDPLEPEATAWVTLYQRQLEELEVEKIEIAERVLQENISRLMEEGKQAYSEGDLETARSKWNNVLSMVPNHQEAEAFLVNTESEYEEYLTDIESAKRTREREEIAREKLYTPITISFTDIKIADFLNQVSLLSDINFVIPYGGDARVSGRFSDTPLIDVLNAVLIPNGFVYTIEGPLVKIALNLKSLVFQLSDYETAQLENLQERNFLSEILYGPGREATIPGQKYVLDSRRNVLVITDTALNIQKIESLLKNLPDQILPELVTRMYTVRRNVGAKVKMLLEALLETESTMTERQIPGRKVLFESSTDTLIIRDTLRNVDLAENFLMDREFIEKVEKDELSINVFTIVDTKLLETDPEQARELARKTTELIKTLLYHRIGETEARRLGRQVWLNEDYGTLTILDTRGNIQKVADFLITAPWRGDEEITEIIYIDYVDVGDLHGRLEEILGIMDVGDPRAVGPDRIVRRLRPGQSFRFRDADIECVRIRDIGPTGERRTREDRDFDGEVTLLVSTPTEIARTITIREREGVQQIGDYVIRIPDANPAARGWADVEVQYLPRDILIEPLLTPVEVVLPPITITPDPQTSALIIRAHDLEMLAKVKYWIERLDIPIPQVTIETRYVTVAEQAMKTLESSLSVSQFSGGFTLDDAQASFRFGGTGVNPIAPLIGGGGTAVSSALSGFQPAGTAFDLSTRGMPVRWTLNLMEARGLARVVTGPQLTILNNQTGIFEIFRTFSVIQRLSYTDVNYEDREVDEMYFMITPQITRRNIINMDIQIDMTEYIPGTPELDARGRRDQDAMFDVSQLTLTPTRDDQKTRSIETRVQLSDGETIVLGGFKTEHMQDTVSRVPILGDIPLIGRVLFGRQHQVRNQENLLIFLTAYLKE